MTANSEYIEIMTAKAWRPEPGDTITGTVVNLRRQDDEYGGHIVVTLSDGATDTQPVYTAVHAFHSVLKIQLTNMKPAVGAPIQITYLGKVDGKRLDKDGKPIPYHSYVTADPTAADPTAAEFDWTEDPAF